MCYRLGVLRVRSMVKLGDWVECVTLTLDKGNEANTLAMNLPPGPSVPLILGTAYLPPDKDTA